MIAVSLGDAAARGGAEIIGAGFEIYNRIRSDGSEELIHGRDVHLAVLADGHIRCAGHIRDISVPDGVLRFLHFLKLTVSIDVSIGIDSLAVFIKATELFHICVPVDDVIVPECAALDRDRDKLGSEHIAELITADFAASDIHAARTGAVEEDVPAAVAYGAVEQGKFIAVDRPEHAKLGGDAMKIAVIKADVFAVVYKRRALRAVPYLGAGDGDILAAVGRDAFGSAAVERTAVHRHSLGIFKAQHAAGAVRAVGMPGSEALKRDVLAVNEVQDVHPARLGNDAGIAVCGAYGETGDVFDDKLRAVADVPAVISGAAARTVVRRFGEHIALTCKLDHRIRSDGGQQLIHGRDLCHRPSVLGLRCGSFSRLCLRH